MGATRSDCRTGGCSASAVNTRLLRSGFLHLNDVVVSDQPTRLRFMATRERSPAHRLHTATLVGTGLLSLLSRLQGRPSPGHTPVYY